MSSIFYMKWYSINYILKSLFLEQPYSKNKNYIWRTNIQIKIMRKNSTQEKWKYEQ